MPINLNMKSLLDSENKSIGYIVGGLFGGKYEPIQQEAALNRSLDRLKMENSSAGCIKGASYQEVMEASER